MTTDDRRSRQARYASTMGVGPAWQAHLRKQRQRATLVAVGWAAVVGTVGGVLVGLWYR